MGAINYITSDYITLGIKPYEADDYTDDSGTIDYCAMNDDYDCDYENIEAEIDNHSFSFFHVTIKPGYYEGFSIYIENNCGAYFDSYYDKKEALKEVTQLKKFLLNCADLGLVEVCPGWCTSYMTYAETITSVNQAMKGLRVEVAGTPTWSAFNKESERIA